MNDSIKPQLNQLQIKLSEISLLANQMKKREEKIIFAANEINSVISEQIQNDLNEKQTYTSSEEKVKAIRARLEASQNLVDNIKAKIALIKEKTKNKD